MASSLLIVAAFVAAQGWRRVACAVAALAALRYVAWRLVATLDATSIAEGALSVLLLAAEVAALVCVLRRLRDDAAGEATIPSTDAPAAVVAPEANAQTVTELAVDVVIDAAGATPERVRHTAVMCRALDWPQLTVWIGGGDEAATAVARETGVRMLCGATVADAEAGPAADLTAPVQLVLRAGDAPAGNLLRVAMASLTAHPSCIAVHVPCRGIGVDALERNLGVDLRTWDDVDSIDDVVAGTAGTPHRTLRRCGGTIVAPVHTTTVTLPLVATPASATFAAWVDARVGHLPRVSAAALLAALAALVVPPLALAFGVAPVAGDGIGLAIAGVPVLVALAATARWPHWSPARHMVAAVVRATLAGPFALRTWAAWRRRPAPVATACPARVLLTATVVALLFPVVRSALGTTTTMWTALSAIWCVANAALLTVAVRASRDRGERRAGVRMPVAHPIRVTWAAAGTPVTSAGMTADLGESGVRALFDRPVPSESAVDVAIGSGRTAVACRARVVSTVRVAGADLFGVALAWDDIEAATRHGLIALMFGDVDSGAPSTARSARVRPARASAFGAVVAALFSTGDGGRGLLRRAARLDCRRTATVATAQGRLAVMLTDVSDAGARARVSGTDDGAIQFGMRVELRLKVAGGDTLVLPARVVKVDGAEFSMSFNPMSASTRGALLWDLYVAPGATPGACLPERPPVVTGRGSTSAPVQPRREVPVGATPGAGRR